MQVTHSGVTRTRNARATRSSLLAAAEALFVERSFADVSGQQIAAAVGATRGALQHHFGSKAALFVALVDRMQTDAAARIEAAMDTAHDPWSRARAGMIGYLDQCAEPNYRKIVLIEAPAALGWSEWRTLDAQKFTGMIAAEVADLGAHGLRRRNPEMQAATVYGSLTEMALVIAESEAPRVAREEAIAVVDDLLEALRA